jgi:hypothetical protein
VTLRKVPGALALGLLASLAAHTGLFGESHAMGGEYHALLVQAALAGSFGLVAFFGALAWSSSGLTADGSVVVSRLRDRLPNLGGVVASAVTWYAVAEAIEPHHAPAPTLFAIAALVASAWLVLRLAVAVAHALGAAAFLIRRGAFAPRLPVRKPRPQLRPLARRPLLARRRFARPPPIVAAFRA